MAITDLQEIIQHAAKQEERAHKFYMDALKFVKDPAADKWLEELAQEELKHKEMLDNFDISKIDTIKPEKIQDLHIAEFLVEKDVSEIKDFQDVLIVAMKKEQRSYDFYVDMAKTSESPDVKKLCRFLAQEELKHKHKLELYYDDMIFQED